MNVQNSPGKLLHEPGRQQPHISGKTDQFDFMLLQRGNDLAVMLLARSALGRNYQVVEPALACRRDPRRVGLVGNDHGYARIGNTARINAVRNGDEVRAAPGKEYSERMRHS